MILSDSERAMLLDGVAVTVDDHFDSLFMKALLDDARTLVATEPTRLQAAKFGSDKNVSSVLRGDRTCWVTVDLCKDLHLDAMKTLVQKLIKGTKNLVEDLDLIPDYSLQFAIYPGNGAGYVKHLDFDRTKHKHEGNTTNTGRKLTAILYLNEEWEGGQLRTYNQTTDGVEDVSCAGSIVDIDPSLGRMVLFRSDIVEHEVLPSWRDRMALTFWISGRYHNNDNINNGSNNNNTSISSNSSGNGNTAHHQHQHHRQKQFQLPLRIPKCLSCPFGNPHTLSIDHYLPYASLFTQPNHNINSFFT